MTFPNYKFGKGQYTFYPIELSRLAEKIKFVEASPTNEKLYKSIIFWGGSGHPNFMNPFEYGESFLDKLFPKL